MIPSAARVTVSERVARARIRELLATSIAHRQIKERRLQDLSETPTNQPQSLTELLVAAATGDLERALATESRYRDALRALVYLSAAEVASGFHTDPVLVFEAVHCLDLSWEL